MSDFQISNRFENRTYFGKTLYQNGYPRLHQSQIPKALPEHPDLTVNVLLRTFVEQPISNLTSLVTTIILPTIQSVQKKSVPTSSQALASNRNLIHM